jgi:YVTN family beta-propeller protein
MHRLVIGWLLLSAAVHAAEAPRTPVNPSPAGYTVEQRFELGGAGGWDYLLVDPAAPRLFIARSDRVLVMSTRDGALMTTIPNTSGVHGIALAPSLGKGFTSNGAADNVTVFDLESLNVVATVPVKGHNPDAILYDPASGNLYTFNGGSHDVSIIDPTRGVTVATLSVGGKPEFAATDAAGRIFVNIEDTSQIVEIDTFISRRVATWSLPECSNPTGLAIDVTHQRLFSTCANGLLAVTDSSSGKSIARVPIGRGPDAAVFDSQRKLIFSSNGADGTLTVIHEDDPDHYSVVESVPTQKSARTLALDPMSHLLYTVAAQFGPPTAPSAERRAPRAPVIDGTFAVLVVGK